VSIINEFTFFDLIQTAQAIAIAGRLSPDEKYIYDRVCREYSKDFSTPLHIVHTLNPEFVLTNYYAEQFSNWNLEESADEIRDMIGALNDPEYDAKREAELREMDRRMLAEEEERVKDNKAIHPVLEKKKSAVIMPEENIVPEGLPKSGGLNSKLIQQLRNDGGESEGF